MITFATRWSQFTTVSQTVSWVPTREKHADMDSIILCSWAENFWESIKSKTLNKRKFFFINDLYSSHLDIKALENLKRGGSIINFIPAHTSGLYEPFNLSFLGFLRLT